MKMVYVLIGSRGSGKTRIGQLIEKELGIKFLLVEPYFLKAAKGEDYKNPNNVLFNGVWEKIGKDIDSYLENNGQIVFESLGVFDSFKGFLQNLKKKYRVKLIKIDCPQEICLARIKDRDPSHVQIDAEDVEKIRVTLEKEDYKFDLAINNKSLSDREIVSLFKKFVNSCQVNLG